MKRMKSYDLFTRADNADAVYVGMFVAPSHADAREVAKLVSADMPTVRVLVFGAGGTVGRLVFDSGLLLPR